MLPFCTHQTPSMASMNTHHLQSTKPKLGFAVSLNWHVAAFNIVPYMCSWQKLRLKHDKTCIKTIICEKITKCEQGLKKKKMSDFEKLFYIYLGTQDQQLYKGQCFRFFFQFTLYIVSLMNFESSLNLQNETNILSFETQTITVAQH